MKQRILLIAIFLVPVFIFGQVLPVKTEIKSAKVYLSGAELFHTAKARLEKGNSEIIFENISANFDINSVSVTGKGNFILTSIGQQYNYLRNSFKPAEIKTLEDSLEIVKTEMMRKRNDRDVLLYESDLILKNGTLAGRQANVTVAEVQKYADYIKKRVTEIKKETLIIDKELEKLQKKSDRITHQLQELNNKYNQPVNQITVSVTANAPVNAEFEITYFVSEANWVPVYDVRVQDIAKPIKLSYMAKVRQNTGIDWDNVKIILSSRNPQVSQTKPELYPWYLDFLKLKKELRSAGGVREMKVQAAEAAPQAVNDRAAEEAETMANYTVLNENLLTVEFETSIPYSVPSDGKPYSVNLKEYELPGIFEYYAAPKLENDAFLITYMTKWNDYNFLPGEANTYFQNSYIGKTYINPNISKDTLILSLGRDKGINVSRTAIKDFTEDKFLSSDIERTFAYDIKIKNNKNRDVKVLVEEIIPISKNEDITVKLIESSGAIYDKETGKLKWEISLEAGKSATKKLIYSVRHPKDKPVMGL